MPLIVTLKLHSLLMDQALHVNMAYQKFIKHLLMVFQLIDQISQIGSPTYKIVKYLLAFISLITKNEYTVKDSFEFVSMIDKEDHNSFMCSLCSQMFL